MKTLISIVGPTASGKTALAVEWALKLGTAVISADSRQIYKSLSIGTAKPGAGERKGVPHYLIDEVEPDVHFNAGMYARRVQEICEHEFKERDTLILAGGSGLYLSAVWEGLDEIPDVPAEIREGVQTDLKEKGLEVLLRELKQNDPELYERIDRSNPRRVTRGVEVFRATRRPLSSFQKGGQLNLPGLRQVKIGLDLPRAELHGKIEARAHEMMRMGLLQEVKDIVARYGSELKALQTVGYSEIIAHLRGEYGLERAVELIIRNTRRYARRQLTWFRRYEDIRWFRPDQINVEEIL